MKVDPTLAAAVTMQNDLYQTQLGVAIGRQRKREQEGVLQLVTQAASPPPQGMGGRVDQSA